MVTYISHKIMHMQIPYIWKHKPTNQQVANNTNLRYIYDM